MAQGVLGLVLGMLAGASWLFTLPCDRDRNRDGLLLWLAMRNLGLDILANNLAAAALLERHYFLLPFLPLVFLPFLPAFLAPLTECASSTVPAWFWQFLMPGSARVAARAWLASLVASAAGPGRRHPASPQMVGQSHAPPQILPDQYQPNARRH